MAQRVSVKLTWNQSKINLANVNARKGLFRMGFDIAAQARRNAPYVTGALRNTIRVQEAGNDSVEVVAGGTYGGKRVPYAWKREIGPNRNPATVHYMQNAASAIMTGDYIKKYFGGLL